MEKYIALTHKVTNMNKTKTYFLYILPLLIIVHLHRQGYAASWTTFKKNHARTGSAVEYIAPPLKPLWYFETQGGFFQQPSIYRDTVFAGCRDGSVWAWRASDGEVIWQYSTDGWVDSTPCVWKNYVITPSRDGKVYCFDRINGEVIWVVDTGNANVSSPIVYKDVLYFMSGSPGTDIWKVNPLNGTLIKKIQLSQYGFSSPSIQDNILVVGTNDGKINIIDTSAGGGTLIKTIPTMGGIKFITPVIKDNRIYTSTDGDERRIYAFDTSGNLIWKTPQLSNKPMSASSVVTSPDENCGYVSIATDNDTMLLLKFSLTDGTTLWIKNTGKPSSTGKLAEPVIANELIYTTSGDGFLRILDKNGNYIEPFTGNAVAISTGVYLGGEIVAPCVISDGKIFVGTMNNQFWAFECSRFTSLNNPDEYDVIINSASIILNTSETGNYSIEYKKSSDNNWQNLSSGVLISSGNFSSDINISDLSDGDYELRITINESNSKRALTRFTIDNPPAMPQELSASDTLFDGGGSITLSWKKSPDDGAGDNDVIGYKIFRSSWSGGFIQISTVVAGITSFIDSGLLNNVTFYYCLKSYDSLSDSAFSNIASAYATVDGKLISSQNGGVVLLELPDGTTVEVILPAGWYEEDGYIGIIPAANIYPEDIPSSARKTSRFYQFGARKLSGEYIENFSKPVTIVIPYLPAEVQGMVEENLRIYRYDPDKKKWGVVNNSTVDTIAKKVSVTVPKFSLYGIMEYIPGKEEIISFEKVYTYPNPAKGGKVYFKYFVDETADIVIDVYNVAGELVAHLTKTNNPAGIVSEIEWDTSQLASGVYIWRIEAKGITSKRNKALKKKLAIIN